MLSVGIILNGAFRLVRERPVSVLTWGLVYTAVTFAGLFAVLLPMMKAQMAVMTNLSAGATPGTLPPGFDPLAMMGQIYLFDFLLLVLLVVLLAAGLRAVLRPEARAFAYLRIGMDELRLLGLFVLAFLGLMAASVVFGIVFGIIAAATVGLSPGQGTGGLSLAVTVMVLVLLAVVTFLQVRLSPCLALTMLRGKITVTDAWRLTRGRFWTLFGGYFVLGLILTAVYVAIASVIAYPIMHALMTSPGFASGTAPLAPAAVAAQLGGVGFGAIGLIGFVLFVALAGVGIAFMSGGIATATAALLQEEYGEASVR